MRNKFCLVLLLLFAMLQSSGAFATDNNRVLLERSIGKLILMSDSAYSYEHGENPFGDGPTAHEAEILYEKHIKHLPEKSKVDYFWALMWHFDFVYTSLSRSFEILILRDCGPAFIKKLEKYIEMEEELPRDKRKLRIAKQFLIQLKHYQDSEEWKRLQSKKIFDTSLDK